MADVLQTTLDAIDTMRSEALEATSRLESIAALPFLSWFDFSQLEGFNPEAPNQLEFFERLPELESVSLRGLENINQAQLDKYKRHIWGATNFNDLQKKLMKWVETGGVGISEDTQTAIFEQGYERSLQVLRDKLDLAGARTGGKGARYANSFTKSLQAQALTEWGYGRDDLNREIVKIISDLAQKNVQFAIQQDVAIETIHSNFAINYSKLFLDIYKMILERFRVEQEARIAEFEGKIKTLDMDVRIKIAQGSLDMDHQQRLLAAWDKEATLLVERGKAQIAQSEQANRVKLSAASNLAEVYINSLNSLNGNATSIEIKKVSG